MMQHEKLICYQNLLALAAELTTQSLRWPKGSGWLADQLKRAIGSALLNLSEGNGKQQGRLERHRFFQMSLGSIAESSTILDLAKAYRYSTKEDVQRQKGTLLHAYNQIRKLP